MKVLITGGEGQLGKTFFKKMPSGYEVDARSKKDVDVTDAERVDHIIGRCLPDFVFHAAAYTAVDRCETERKKAIEVNALGSLNVARACKRYGAKLVYISSDYVFDGAKGEAYTEADIPNPKNMYGLSKWTGEELIRRTVPQSYIVRTSWLYGHGGNNFVNTMKKFAKRRQEVQVVCDQIGCPTYADDLAEKCTQLIGKPYGIYHICNAGTCSWYDFACAVYESLHADPSLVRPVSTEEYGALAPRPAFSVLKLEKIAQSGISKPRMWREALKEFMAKEELE